MSCLVSKGSWNPAQNTGLPDSSSRDASSSAMGSRPYVLRLGVHLSESMFEDRFDGCGLWAEERVWIQSGSLTTFD